MASVALARNLVPILTSVAHRPLNASAATMAMATDIACKPMIKTMMGITLPPVKNASVSFEIEGSSKSGARVRVGLR